MRRIQDPEGSGDGSGIPFDQFDMARPRRQRGIMLRRRSWSRSLAALSPRPPEVVVESGPDWCQRERENLQKNW